MARGVAQIVTGNLNIKHEHLSTWRLCTWKLGDIIANFVINFAKVSLL